MTDSVWTKKEETFSDKSAKEEFCITQEEIIEAINSGKFQYRINNMYGNPYFKLVRSEVEAFIAEKYGKDRLEEVAKIHFVTYQKV